MEKASDQLARDSLEEKRESTEPRFSLMSLVFEDWSSLLKTESESSSLREAARLIGIRWLRIS